jgi:hypothetical protein
MAMAATSSAAKHKPLEQKYTDLRVAVIKHFDTRTAGRNIRRQGFRTPKGRVIKAQPRHLARSIRTFRRWLAPPVVAAQPGDRISSNPSYAGGSYAIPRAIVMCESGGNYRSVNNTPAGAAAGRPAGAYQIVTGTWIGAGGGKYAPTADAATPAQQDEIVGHIWNGGAGAGQWECKG